MHRAIHVLEDFAYAANLVVTVELEDGQPVLPA